MSARPLSAYTSVRTEGALLPADILARIAAGDATFGGLDPASYHLDPSEKIGEATNRAWNRLQARWASFQTERAKLAPTDTGTSLTRERWLLPLFEELKFGRLQHAAKVEIDGKSYAVSHSWQHVPIHLVGCQVDLDKRIVIAGAQRSSPHSLVQELLNRSPHHLWGMVSNGLRLRLLRDNVSLTRQAYVEFDLEAMMAGEAYPDFVLLWLILHQSRFEGERPELCQLEKWSQAARTEGVRVLDGLRDGVQKAIEHLGQGFLAHPANSALREKLRTGALDKQDYYRQLLRLVYRLLFLFVAEDRDLLLVPTADPVAQKRYREHYATTRLRRLATTRAGSRHHDLYCGLKLVMDKLSGDGCPELALPALGSFLFSPKALPDLEGCEISNLHLLEAIRSLAVTQTGQSRRVVDYKNLGAEELGSVYESLLELHPDLNAEAATFELKVAAGSERKKTGSYYTPTSLISCLLDSALDPVLDEAAQQPDPEAAILKLKVVDPACGSGHFLIAAAHRIAKRLAAVRTGEEEPPPEAQRKALRDVIGHCIYGVDLNPMAVELCKVSLWMEALEPGKPLSFLEHRIQCGNSLLGATPALLAGGIPDEAFTPLTGDTNGAANKWKRVNRNERQSRSKAQFRFKYDEPWMKLGNFAQAMAEIDAIDDGDISSIQLKEQRWQAAVESSDYLDGKLLADAWCAAFAWRKDSLTEFPLTEDIFREIERNPNTCAGHRPGMYKEILGLAAKYRFFHWHLAFPDVFRVPSSLERPENEQTGWSGGFDAVLGNPPWEKFTIGEEEWFAALDADISETKGKARRGKQIEALAESNPILYNAWQEAKRDADLFAVFCSRDSGRYPLTGTGELNTYHLFAELAEQILAPRGRVGIVVKTGIGSADNCLPFIKRLTDSRRLITSLDFVNTKELFRGVQTVERFTLISFGGSAVVSSQVRLATLCQDVQDLAAPGRVYTLSPEDIRKMSPLNGALPLLKGERDAEILRRVYDEFPVLDRPENISDGEDRWRVEYVRIFDMAVDSGHFKRREELEAMGLRMDARRRFVTNDEVYLPLYEGKYIYHFDHRYGSFETVPASKRYGRKATAPAPELSQLQDPHYEIVPRYWFPQSVWEERRRQKGLHPEYQFHFRDVAGVYPDLRTAIGAIVASGPAGHKAPVLSLRGPVSSPEAYAASVLAFACLFCSTSFDYVVRNKLFSKSLTVNTLSQIPLPRPSAVAQWPVLAQLALELSFTTWSLEPLGRALGCPAPFRYDPERRFLLQCEIDAIVAHLYGLARADFEHVLTTFETLARHEERTYGEYRTKRETLAAYDCIAEAKQAGIPYQSRLDPPPADPRAAHPCQSEVR